jgi:hypothetical protein
MGRRQLEQSLGHLGSQAAGHRDDDADGEDTPDVEHEPAPGPSARSASGAVTPPGAAPGHGDALQAVETPPRPSVWLGGGGPNGSDTVSSLAIPGYDSLSASQVVQRLEGLSSPELEEVRAHEAAHRQRRTILHRVEQLLTGGDGVAT